MAKRPVQSVRAARDALETLGHQVRLGRHARNWTAAELADRVGVSQKTILAIEGGAAGTAVGTVFTAAALVGVPLFGTTDKAELARLRRSGEERLALIASRVYHSRDGAPDADF
jgi:transcriptional regulator with XRE-family HTH domain